MNSRVKVVIKNLRMSDDKENKTLWMNNFNQVSFPSISPSIHETVTLLSFAYELTQNNPRFWWKKW